MTSMDMTSSARFRRNALAERLWRAGHTDRCCRLSQTGYGCRGAGEPAKHQHLRNVPVNAACAWTLHNVGGFVGLC